ncbi:hypothetical protein JMA_26070 [Jeotgalibacillus malaysiensis]|uniref:Uncharacterized protein n=1 Tax=Jeotgalibacillus malaysiensis TaxID=1508404 RepID=A0A0B5AVA1_9BACL|nr:hypothetical protein JMA_26070 [Jeotgalibacillus malaysiensis]
MRFFRNSSVPEKAGIISIHLFNLLHAQSLGRVFLSTFILKAIKSIHTDN